MTPRPAVLPAADPIDELLEAVKWNAISMRIKGDAELADSLDKLLCAARAAIYFDQTVMADLREKLTAREWDICADCQHWHPPEEIVCGEVDGKPYCQGCADAQQNPEAHDDD